LPVKEDGFIEGKVVNAYTGEPIEGASVIARHRFFGLGKERKSETDGTYRIENLYPDRFDVYCHKDGKKSNIRKDVSVKSGETTKKIDLRVYKSGSISGKVITSGELQQGYQVWVKEDGRFGGVQSDGAYEVEFTGESGRRSLQLYAPDVKFRIDEPIMEICLDVRDGEVIEGADFEL